MGVMTLEVVGEVDAVGPGVGFAGVGETVLFATCDAGEAAPGIVAGSGPY